VNVRDLIDLDGQQKTGVTYEPIDEKCFLPVTNWHSPIFQSAGAAIIEALWSRVLAGLDKR